MSASRPVGQDSVVEPAAREGVLEVIVRRSLPASADCAWDLVGDFAAKWCAISACAVRGEGIGAVREVVGQGGIANGLVLRQTLLALDPVQRLIRYDMTDSDGLPWRNYVAEIRVVGAGAACEVLWRCQVWPLTDTALITNRISQTYNVALDNLERMLAA